MHAAQPEIGSDTGLAPSDQEDPAASSRGRSTARDRGSNRGSYRSGQRNADGSARYWSIKGFRNPVKCIHTFAAPGVKFDVLIGAIT